jgi:D-glycero-D-manno-heptose 1,7-bisphosphate phosphatase
MNSHPAPGAYLTERARAVVAAGRQGGRALFLDRDGVININHGYVHTPEETEWVPGIFELCAEATRRGYELIVVTNQAGIARGYYSVAEFLDYTAWVHAQFAARGVPLLATFYCPHHPTAGLGPLQVDCDCRKPKPGMILAASEMLGIDRTKSLLLGDQPSDLEAAEAAGLRLAVMFDSESTSVLDEAARLFA